MSLFDSEHEAQEPVPTERALIAFGPRGATALWATKAFRDDMDEGCYDVDDCFPDDKDVPSQGIWMWEGQIVGITYPSSPNGPEEYDVEYQGKWRKPHDYEWALIQRGESPVPLEAPTSFNRFGEPLYATRCPRCEAEASGPDHTPCYHCKHELSAKDDDPLEAWGPFTVALFVLGSLVALSILGVTLSLFMR